MRQFDAQFHYGFENYLWQSHFHEDVDWELSREITYKNGSYGDFLKEVYYEDFNS